MDKMDRNYKFFLTLDFQPYRGEWIAICDERVISHSVELRKVRAEAARLFPDKESLFGMIPRQGSIFF